MPFINKKKRLPAGASLLYPNIEIKLNLERMALDAHL